VTSDRVPSFSDCQVVNSTQCSFSVTWNLNNSTSTIVVDGRGALSTNDAAEDMITAMVFMDIGPDKETPLLAHEFFYACTSSDKCNDETGLKRVLRSLVIEDRFRQELSSLIKIVSPFDAKSAACFDFNNFTGYCPPKDLNICQRCQISVDELLSPSQGVCATCPQYSINTNMVTHSTTIMLNSRTQLSDHVQLNCQLRGCNSIENVNQIYKTSKIRFDFNEFFKNSS
jgi:hypothetical protein